MTPRPFIIGTTIDLYGLTPADAEGRYVEWLNDAEVCEFNSHHVFPYTREAALAFIADMAKSKTDLVLAIAARTPEPVHVGNIALHHLHPVNRSAEFAIILGEKDYWGKGIASEASRLILSHGFDALNVHRIYCGTSSENTAMQKPAQSLGMKEEGRRREAIYKNGRYADVIEYGLLRADFMPS